ncbi:MAG: hypothetical protein EA396_14780 [Anaerolineaceae bacterium]|nr:MAG: hypothetical protein EA396_14780 [Anaerolineaceae bacterium]
MLEWSALIESFTLGNLAITTNVCLLPLYPGLIAFLAGSVQQGADGEGAISGGERPMWVTGLLGLFVLLGVLAVMLLLALILHGLKRTFSDIFEILLPMVYLLVIVLGLGMIAGWNPFTKMSTFEAPIFKNPFLTAFLYGMLLGPMTLPCTGPIILGGLSLTTVGASTLQAEIAYFMAFGFGFGWPLLALSLAAAPLQKRFIGWMTRNHLQLTRFTGVVLIAIGLFGFWTEFVQGVSTV